MDNEMETGMIDGFIGISKVWVPFPRIRIIVLGCLHSGALVYGNYHLGQTVAPWNTATQPRHDINAGLRGFAIPGLSLQELLVGTIQTRPLLKKPRMSHQSAHPGDLVKEGCKM